ncbi:MTH1187 family thiamine-binding protein [Peribacillus deserti]|uniref:Thiamine-binding protein domain-containing protein n=1 Tax=Peribacillus deserti TaxID=673318 RepID=A0A2N5LZJ4_9BACI|nr:MTH1187 family thiamine-binding protein [Peribacillus deserti]PLT27530.1 hypothetical protein CUU66_23385 [Peribacillus deserti]
MAIVDFTIIPVGTETTSVSKYVADIQHLLTRYQTEEKIKFQLTPMSTIIEGDLEDIFKIISEIHEEVFNKGTMRIATNIRIDDRRDKKSSMESKLKRVRDKM